MIRKLLTILFVTVLAFSAFTQKNEALMSKMGKGLQVNMTYPKRIDVSAGYLFNKNGGTIALGAGYFISQRNFVDAYLSYRRDTDNGVEVTRNGLTLGFNRVLKQLNNGIMFTAGAGLSLLTQDNGDFETSSGVANMLVGPNLTGEIWYNVYDDWSVVLKANQSIYFNQETSDGKLMLANYGILIRKQF